MFEQTTPLQLALGLNKLDANLAELLQERLDIIKHKLKFVENKPSVLFIDRLEPVANTGSEWIPELINIAGGAPATNAIRSLTWPEIQGIDADIIILAIASVPQSISKVGGLLRLPGFSQLKAAKTNRIYMADGERYFNHPGPELIDALEMLAEMIHPKQFVFGNEGESWTRFEL